MNTQHARKAFIRAREEAAQSPSLPSVRYFRSSLREPDYCENYRELYDIEVELNRGEHPFADYELLSVWRLARDPAYAQWAHSIGTRRCQITLFGATAATNDWGYGRRGAHADAVAATDACIEAGIVPRWQVFQTKRAIPELDDLLGLVDSIDLRARVSALGDEFVLFMHDPTPTGAARDIEPLRITRSDVPAIPESLRDSTARHFGEPIAYTSEAEWIRVIADNDKTQYQPRLPGEVWLYITADWNAYPNLESLEPWWLLGNLLRDGFSGVAATYLRGEVSAFQVIDRLSEYDLSLRYGDANSERVYMSRGDLTALWFEKYCEEMHSHQGGKTQLDRR